MNVPATAIAKSLKSLTSLRGERLGQSQGLSLRRSCLSTVVTAPSQSLTQQRAGFPHKVRLTGLTVLATVLAS